MTLTSFLIIGAGKAGKTSLYHHVVAHAPKIGIEEPELHAPQGTPAATPL